MSKKTILCPKCHRKVGYADTQTTMTLEYVCHHCSKAVRYIGETAEVKIAEKPERTTSSGARFY